jgi:hypothetical protein
MNADQTNPPLKNLWPWLRNDRGGLPEHRFIEQQETRSTNRDVMARPAWTEAKLGAAMFILDSLMHQTLVRPFEDRPDILALQTCQVNRADKPALWEIRALMADPSFPPVLSTNAAVYGKHASLEEILGGPLREQSWLILGELLAKLARLGYVY